MSTSNISNGQLLGAQLFISIMVWFVSQSQSTENAFKWATMVARYTIYLLTARGMQEAYTRIRNSLTTKRLSLPKLFEENKLSWMTYTTALFFAAMSKETLFGEELLLFLPAFFICQYLQMEQKPRPTINYGTGMACSFFEGYLKHVIPSDGRQDGFVEKIRKWEDSQGVVFPVKRLLLVIMSSLYCPRDLSELNKHNRHDLPQIKACVDKSLEEVKKDVAAVKNRSYSNTTYVISWPDHSHPPVYIVAECATPLHTLYGVLENHRLYRELVKADKSELVSDFVNQLQNILNRSPDCRGKCELVFFDDTEGSNEYLPEVLLQKVAELEPNYREIIERHEAENAESRLPLEIDPASPPRVLIPPA